METFVIDAAIEQSTFAIGERDGIHYRLHENAQVMWFVVLPETVETEFYRLPAALQQAVCEATNTLSQMILQQYQYDKINLATIGNLVSQMHIHVIGRRFDDAYWPDVVWGKPFHKSWSRSQVDDIRHHFSRAFTT